MANLLNTASIMMCPHGGTVQAISANTRVVVGGATALRASDTFVIVGCPFNVILPHPCVRVQWVQSDTRSQTLGDFTLSAQSVGLCLAADQAVQGMVLILATQPQVSGI